MEMNETMGYRCSGPIVREMCDRVDQSMSASFWLKDALRSALDRDPVDAWGDVKVLESVFRAILDRE